MEFKGGGYTFYQQKQKRDAARTAREAGLPEDVEDIIQQYVDGRTPNTFEALVTARCLERRKQWVEDNKTDLNPDPRPTVEQTEEWVRVEGSEIVYEFGAKLERTYRRIREIFDNDDEEYRAPPPDVGTDTRPTVYRPQVAPGLRAADKAASQYYNRTITPGPGVLLDKLVPSQQVVNHFLQDIEDFGVGTLLDPAKDALAEIRTRAKFLDSPLVQQAVYEYAQERGIHTPWLEEEIRDYPDKKRENIDWESDSESYLGYLAGLIDRDEVEPEYQEPWFRKRRPSFDSEFEEPDPGPRKVVRHVSARGRELEREREEKESAYAQHKSLRLKAEDLHMQSLRDQSGPLRILDAPPRRRDLTLEEDSKEDATGTKVLPPMLAGTKRGREYEAEDADDEDEDIGGKLKGGADGDEDSKEDGNGNRVSPPLAGRKRGRNPLDPDETEDEIDPDETEDEDLEDLRRRDEAADNRLRNHAATPPLRDEDIPAPAPNWIAEDADLGPEDFWWLDEEDDEDLVQRAMQQPRQRLRDPRAGGSLQGGAAPGNALDKWANKAIFKGNVEKIYASPEYRAARKHYIEHRTKELTGPARQYLGIVAAGAGRVLPGADMAVQGLSNALEDRMKPGYQAEPDPDLEGGGEDDTAGDSAADTAFKATTGTINGVKSAVEGVETAHKIAQGAEAGLKAAQGIKVLAPYATTALETAAPVVQGLSAASKALAPLTEFLGPVGIAAQAAIMGYNLYKDAAAGKELEHWEDTHLKGKLGRDARRAAMYFNARDVNSNMDPLHRKVLLGDLRSKGADASPITRQKIASTVPSNWQDALGDLASATSFEFNQNEKDLAARQAAFAGVPDAVIRNDMKQRKRDKDFDPGQAQWTTEKSQHRLDARFNKLFPELASKVPSAPETSSDEVQRRIHKAHGVGGSFEPVPNVEASNAPLAKQEAVSLSGDQVTQKAGGGIKVLRYPDLAGIKDWAELTNSPHQAAAILFLTTAPNVGHWICTFNGPDGAHVFDPLGLALDAERQKISTQMQQQLGETQPQLARLVDSSGKPVKVSRTDFQDSVPDMNTCGRWVATRLQYRNLTDEAFKALVAAGCQQFHCTPDAWVTAHTERSSVPAHSILGGKIVDAGIAEKATRQGLLMKHLYKIHPGPCASKTFAAMQTSLK